MDSIRSKLKQSIKKYRPKSWLITGLVGAVAIHANAEWQDISFEDFENGFVEWQDGGNDVFLRKNTVHVSSGVNSANIQDGSGPKSTVRQKVFDATPYSELEISFWYQPVSMELDEFFRIQFEEANGKWANLVDFVKGVDFLKNGNEYNATVTISAADYDFGEASRFRIRNFGNTNADDVYLDDILVRGNTVATSTPTATPTITSTPTATPTSTPEPSETVVEAETGDTTGDVRPYDDSAASGGQGIAYMDEPSESLTFFDVPASRSITVRYAAENSGKISVKVNSVDVGDLPFTATGGWSGDGNYQEIRMDLDIPASASLAFVFEDGDASLNIDSVTFSARGKTPTPHPNGSPSLFCNYSPNDETIDADINATLTVSCLSQFGADRPSISATWNGTSITPVSSTPSDSLTPYEVTNVYEIPLLDVLPVGTSVNSFTATAFNTGAEGPTILNRTFNVINRGDPLPANVLAPALPTPIKGLVANPFGFVFDLDGRNVEVRAGDGTVDQMAPGDDYSVKPWEMVCSNDQVTFHSSTLQVVNDSTFIGTVPEACSGKYYYYFLYRMGAPTTNNPDSDLLSTALFVEDENDPSSRINPANLPTINSVTSDWLRFQKIQATTGLHLAIFDATHNNRLLESLDRFTVTSTESDGNVRLVWRFLNHTAEQASIVRMEALQLVTEPNSNAFHILNTGCTDDLVCDFDGLFNYGQIVRFQARPIVTGNGTQDYIPHLSYVMGKGFDSQIADPRLALAGRATTRPLIADFGLSVEEEANAIFTQHLTTLHDSKQVDTFLKGHHLVHGVDPNVRGSRPGDVLIGSTFCGDCHFRDGRSSKVIDVPNVGQRIAPPLFGLGLLQWMEGRETGFTWNGTTPTVADQVVVALRNDHGVEANTLPAEDLRMMQEYSELVSLPAREIYTYRDETVVRGDQLFNEIGCTNCHVPMQKTRDDAPAGFDNIVIRPYTDMKLHNVNGGLFRTPPLWGLGRNITMLERNNRAVLFMHDGGATSLAGAISAHDGEAQDAVDNYSLLNATDRATIISFLKSL